MNTDTFLLGLVLGLIMLLALNAVYFFDWMGLLRGLLALIAPGKTFQEVEADRNMRKTARYKAHRRRWRLRFLLVPAVFAVCDVAISFAARQLLIGWFGSLVVSVIVYEALSRREKKEWNSGVDPTKK